MKLIGRKNLKKNKKFKNLTTSINNIINTKYKDFKLRNINIFIVYGN